MPKVNGKGQAAILTNDQIDAVIQLCKKPYCFAVEIAAFTGCRMGEALQLSQAVALHFQSERDRKIP
ncbi:hypothetical protein C7B65_24800 [Phormidesmis priestleyi ULC007]|uniref:Tyr recombinase domain-containing protein n=1 Tax=Phormidesmis priestleyi ULC007 TaxID=1920490 RepID=A0A2T1D428_9CYAN|nr:hypothetical protein [Phormidesmis priestleyi]PSB15275.1 hypothetical protein C7B65_24800 [Phormidesmis priestleyi ULC007]